MICLTIPRHVIWFLRLFVTIPWMSSFFSTCISFWLYGLCGYLDRDLMGGSCSANCLPFLQYIPFLPRKTPQGTCSLKELEAGAAPLVKNTCREMYGKLFLPLPGSLLLRLHPTSWLLEHQIRPTLQLYGKYRRFYEVLRGPVTRFLSLFHMRFTWIYTTSWARAIIKWSLKRLPLSIFVSHNAVPSYYIDDHIPA